MTSEYRSVDIRSSMVSMMTIVLLETDLQKIGAGLQQRVSQAPAFFKNTPVIVDFSSLQIDSAFDFNGLFKLIRQQKLLPVAVRGIPKELAEKMQEAGVPIVEKTHGSANGLRRDIRERAGKALVISEVLSAGRQCVARDGDLVLLVANHSGSELIADGNIHVYGTLRGRAMCGAHGDQEARIFCTSLDAEMVSVAGFEQPLNQLSDSLKNRPVQIRLHNNEVVIEPL